MQERFHEIKHVVRRDVLLGLSYHDRKDGFTIYLMAEVERLEDIPGGMLTRTIPTMTFAVCEHHKGHSIDDSYNNIYQWINGQGYRLNTVEMKHFEEYPLTQDAYETDPEFKIMIPINPKE